MYDIDPARPALRLGADKPRSAADEMADIERKMEKLCARHAELALAIGSKVAQSEPISLSDRVSGSFTIPASETVLGGGQRSDGVLGIVTAVRQNDECVTVKFRAGSPTLTDNDFWSHRHRVMGGSQPLVARSTGMMTPLVRAATIGETRDPVEALRTRETLT